MNFRRTNSPNFWTTPASSLTEHLLQWMIYAIRDDKPDATNWQKAVTIIHSEFHDGTLAKECTWKAVVLILKGKSRDFWWIGLVEVLWKTVTSLLN